MLFRCQWVQDEELLSMSSDSVTFLAKELLLESPFSFFTHPRSKPPLIHWIMWAFRRCPFCWVSGYLVLLSEAKESVHVIPWSSWESFRLTMKNNQITSFYNSNFQFKIYIKSIFLLILYIFIGNSIRNFIACLT